MATSVRTSVHSRAARFLGRTSLASAADRGAHFALRHPLGWAAVAGAALAPLAAGAGAGLGERPMAFGAVVLIAAAATVPLALRGLASRIVNRLDAALVEGAALRSELAAVHETQERLRHLAYHDALTDLPNRSLLYDRLELAVKQAQRRASRIGVLFLDLDDFKAVNDSCGHAAGDRLLVELAGRLRSGVRAGDTVARLGGDEFVVLLDSVTGAEDAARVAAKVRDAVRAPFRRDGREMRVTASVGVSVYPADGSSADELLRSADAAMYRDKERQASLGARGMVRGNQP
jgi:diguanylate cyclase (GGDEF)-like protein